MPSQADIDKGLLCVGGPLAGQRYKAEPGAYQFVAQLPKMLPMSAHAADAMVEGWKIQVTYQHKAFHTEASVHDIWVPVDQNDHQTMTLLLGTYEEAHRR